MLAPTTRPGYVLIDADADPYLRAGLVGMLRQRGCAHKGGQGFAGRSLAGSGPLLAPETLGIV